MISCTNYRDCIWYWVTCLFLCADVWMCPWQMTPLIASVVFVPPLRNRPKDSIEMAIGGSAIDCYVNVMPNAEAHDIQGIQCTMLLI